MRSGLHCICVQVARQAEEQDSCLKCGLQACILTGSRERQGMCRCVLCLLQMRGVSGAHSTVCFSAASIMAAVTFLDAQSSPF